MLTFICEQDKRKFSMYNVGCEVLTEVIMQGTSFWDISPCSMLKVNRPFGGTYQRDNRWQAAASFPRAIVLVHCSAYLSLRMEAVCSFETSINFKLIMRFYIPQDSTQTDVERNIQVQ
jgi:hypothetical protein